MIYPSPGVGLSPSQPGVPIGGFPAAASARQSAFRPTLVRVRIGLCP